LVIDLDSVVILAFDEDSCVFGVFFARVESGNRCISGDVSIAFPIGSRQFFFWFPGFCIWRVCPVLRGATAFDKRNGLSSFASVIAS
jgi:hypothetical protein